MKLNNLTNSVNKETLNWYNWELPKLPRTVCGNTCVYSQRFNTLYSIGGEKCNQVFSLSFNNISAMNDLRWKELPKLNGSRYAPACCMIQNKSTGLQKLCVIAGRTHGYGGNMDAEIFDFSKSNKDWQWEALRTNNEFAASGLYRAGCHFDENAERIYVGGGQIERPRNQMYVCDLRRMQWMSLPPTLKKHNFYPCIWKDNNQKLYITSTNEDVIEWLDLRQHEKNEENSKWNIVEQQGGLCAKGKLSSALNTTFPGDCSVARLLSADAT
eukprot:CAMPEP_0197046848 /NCGR_PEP_ID=MMETSP1384-20130603/22461_1 /TAXON_ID=29189 /ORGANISM="Ammonia sp." /LENGTH=269 /DNA_ID=CAMNT_0042478693 /DNA_START=570 /DNA_END=1379 /DNA_ORIENTATION=-